MEHSSAWIKISQKRRNYSFNDFLCYPKISQCLQSQGNDSYFLVDFTLLRKSFLFSLSIGNRDSYSSQQVIIQCPIFSQWEPLLCPFDMSSSFFEPCLTFWYRVFQVYFVFSVFQYWIPFFEEESDSFGEELLI